MSDSPLPVPKPSRQWRLWLFGLCMVVAIIGLFAIGLPIYEEQQAARDFINQGGTVTWKFEEPDWPPGKRKGVKDQFRKAFSYVSQVDDFLGRGDPRKMPRLLMRFRRLETVWLSGPYLTDDFVEELLENQPNLTEILLVNCGVTDDGLARIGQNKNLEAVALEGASITNDGLKHLKVCTKLDALELSGTAITDDGLWELRSLKNLKDLYVSNTQVSDAGIARLRKVLPNLEVWDD